MFKIKKLMISQGLRICKDCKLCKDLSEFSLINKSYNPCCKPCKAKYTRELIRKNGKYKARGYHGLTVEKKKEANEMLSNKEKKGKVAAHIGITLNTFSKWKGKGFLNEDGLII